MSMIMTTIINLRFLILSIIVLYAPSSLLVILNKGIGRQKSYVKQSFLKNSIHRDEISQHHVEHIFEHLRIASNKVQSCARLKMYMLYNREFNAIDYWFLLILIIYSLNSQVRHEMKVRKINQSKFTQPLVAQEPFEIIVI